VRKQRNPHSDDDINIHDLIDVDIAVLPGCVLYSHALEPYREVLNKLSSRDIPIILLGGGGGNYRDSTQRYVKSCLGSFQIEGLLTRDSTAYECYGDDVKYAYNGIDCAFFINDWYNPPESNKKFVVSTFDKMDEPDIDSEYDIIRTDHEPFGKPHRGSFNKIIRGFGEETNIVYSDLLKDYLFLYANCEVTFADRIHACVPTLIYRNKAQFFFETERSKLFKKIFDKDISNKAVAIDSTKVTSLKSRQISQCQRIISNVSS